LKSNLEVLSDKRIIESAEAVDVSHACWPVEDLKEVAKKFLSPAPNLVNGPVVFQYFLDGNAIAKPVKFSPPKKLAVLTNSPAPAACFTNKRMEVALSLGAAAGAKANWP
jgi:hypothetical protein